MLDLRDERDSLIEALTSQVVVIGVVREPRRQLYDFVHLQKENKVD